MDLSLKIDVVVNPTREQFMRDYYYPQKPVIIKGLIKNTGADSKWDLAFMKEKLGDTEVGVFDNTKSKNSTYVRGDETMKFGNFIDIIRKDETCNYRLFLFDGFKHAPELRKDYPCPSFYRSIIGRIGLMFFGGKNTGVRMHYDVDMCGVLHTQFIGKKKVILIAPEYSPLLYRPPFTAFSLVNFANPDYEKHPAMRHVKGYEIVLEHGDTLFMPSGYWHYMTYLEGGFGVSYRRIAPNIAQKLEGIQNLTINLIIDKIMSKLSRKRWDAYREKIAYRRAEEAVKAMARKSGELMPQF